MDSLKKIMIVITLLLSITVFSAQVNNPTVEITKIFGNCDQCKTTIEKAGSIKHIANVDWNKDTKMATISYNAKKTNADEILKRIALAGYDSTNFLAPDKVYSKLPECCQYKREAKTVNKEKPASEMVIANHADVIDNKVKSQLQPVFDSYFMLKDALVKTDSKSASAYAKELVTAISSVKMEVLEKEEHLVWMKVVKGLSADSRSISETKEIDKQRESFKSLSKNMYDLIKVSKPSQAIYYQYCPMQDANWLSRENAVKNPYYGSQMMTCGKTIETIK